MDDVLAWGDEESALLNELEGKAAGTQPDSGGARQPSGAVLEKGHEQAERQVTHEDGEDEQAWKGMDEEGGRGWMRRTKDA